MIKAISSFLFGAAVVLLVLSWLVPATTHKIWEWSAHGVHQALQARH